MTRLMPARPATSKYETLAKLTDTADGKDLDLAVNNTAGSTMFLPRGADREANRRVGPAADKTAVPHLLRQSEATLTQDTATARKPSHNVSTTTDMPKTSRNND
jgi:hypothetical protein